MSNGQTEQAHNFDRRKNDANVDSLRAIVGGLEDRIVALEENQAATTRELRENTTLTKRAHATALEVRGAVIGTDEAPGLQPRVDEMYRLVQTARNGFALAGKVGNAGMWCIEKSPKLLGAGAVLVGGYIYLKTGKFPDWVLKLVGV